jgi:hypothetical protein
MAFCVVLFSVAHSDWFLLFSRYYYNKRTKQSSWEKPPDLMTPIEVSQITDWLLLPYFIVIFCYLLNMPLKCFSMTTNYILFMDADNWSQIDHNCLCESSFYLHVHWFVDVMASLEKFNDCSICTLWRRRFTFSRQATICYLHLIYHVGSIFIRNWWLDVFG